MSTLNVNTINETTASSGVTVDGVLVKDSTVDNAYVPNAITTLGTEQATTSGTSIDFTGIPSGVKEIKVMFVGVSMDGTSDWSLLLGDAEGFEETGYTGGILRWSSTANTAANATTYFKVLDSVAAATETDAVLHLYLEDAANFTWVLSGLLFSDPAATGDCMAVCGTKALSAELTQIRITSVSADTFDAGAINIQYSF